MSNVKTVDNLDGKKLQKLLDEKEISRKKFSEMVGISAGTIDRYVEGDRKPSLPTFNCMKMILGVEDSDLLITEVNGSQNIPGSIGAVIDNAQLIEKVDKLTTLITQTERDLARLSAVIMDIQRTTKETKAETELLKEEQSALFNKLSTVSSSCGKILGTLKAFKG